ncbi:MAG: DUF6603 domain-containing protein [Chitinophagales bacterium]
MAEREQGTLELIATHLVLAIEPLKEACSSPDDFLGLMYKLGWDSDQVDQAYLNTLSGIVQKVDAAITKIQTLASGGDPSIEDILDLFEKVKEAFEAIANFPVPTGPVVADPAAFALEMTDRLFELLLAEYLRRDFPVAFTLLKMLNVLEYVVVPAPADESRPSFIYPKFHWDQIPEVIKSPAEIPKRIYGWGTATLKFDLLAAHLAALFHAIKLPVTISRMSDDMQRRFYNVPATGALPVRTYLNAPYYYVYLGGAYQELAIALMPLPKDGTKLPGLVLQPVFPRNVSAEISINDSCKLRFIADTNALDLFGVLIRPDEISVRFPGAPGTTITASAGIQFLFEPATPFIILGNPGETRLQLQKFDAGFTLNFDGEDWEVVLDAALHGLALVIQAGETDGFLKSILGTTPLELAMDMGVEWSSIRGVRFKGGGGFEVALHPHLELGPIGIETISIRLYVPAEDPAVNLELGADVNATLGPLKLVVQNIGIQLKANFEEGNLGPFDLNAGFKWPNGVGISIDGGGFSGGGFLGINVEKGEYTGMLELDFKGTLALRAIGIINTKLPDGSEGFSLLIIITAEFTPIQLGYGFTLNGVGGLLGLNRTMLIDPLRAGVSDGSLNSVLFPTDIIQNAPRIISDLQRIFPIQQDRFVFGPMAKIGWGTPTLITLEMGLLIEVPDPVRIAILGVVKTILPEEHVDLVRIQVNFLGVIDFEKQELSFDASLFNSRLLTFTLAGDMVVRLNWGSNPNFLLAIGGFHPAFVPPPMSLPTLRRITLNLIDGDNPRLSIEAYMAVTSNTVQFGSKAELLAEAGSFNVHGILGFDVLIQFNPFYFNAHIYASVDVRTGSTVLFCISLDLMLEGPTPWHARGKASFKILFVKFSVGFNITWGEERTDTLPPVDVLPLLKEALGKMGNWNAVLPENSSQLVTINEIIAGENDIIAHPFGILNVSQKVVPLNLPIDKFGSQSPSGTNQFAITKITVGGSSELYASTKEQFAAAQFITMSDSEKVSRKSFELFDAGISLSSGNSVRCDYGASVEVKHELIYSGRKAPLLLKGLGVSMFGFLLQQNATAKSTLSYYRKSRSPLAAAEVKIQPEQFVITNINDLTVHQGTAAFNTETEARKALQEIHILQPSVIGNLQVIPAYQIFD